MRRSIAALTLSFACASAVAGQQAPVADPEIYLVSVSDAGGKIMLGKPVNITNRVGYDNQPTWSPNGREIFYTSTREDGQADIYRYNIAAKTSQRLTTTSPESEYSATVMPSKERLSVVRVERDSTQRLWSFNLNGSDDRLVLPDMKPVGYHAWIDPWRVALYVLGKPNSLVVANLNTGVREVVAQDVGRSLVPLPNGRGFIYLAHHDSSWVVTEVRLNRSNDSISVARPLVAVPAGMDYVAWIGSTLIGGNGSKMYTWRQGGEWTEVADFSADGVTHITRLALSPDGSSLAIVAEPAPVKP
jgi:dipeptidyl aminopeptidase/acylaminoacyl peptidase